MTNLWPTKRLISPVSTASSASTYQSVLSTMNSESAYRSTLGRWWAEMRVLDGELVQVVEVGDGLELVAVGVVQADPHEVVAPGRLGADAGQVMGVEAEVDPFTVAVQRVVHDHIGRLGRERQMWGRRRGMGAAYAPGMATVILARHGRTAANTGGVLAGRSKGVHLDDTGIAQAKAAAGAPRGAAAGRGGDQPAGALPRDREADGAGTARGRGPAAAGVRLRRVDRPGDQAAGQGEALAHRAGPALRRALPGRRVAPGDVGARGRPRSGPATPRSRTRRVSTPCGWRSPTATRSRRSSPTRSACTSTRSSGSRSTREACRWSATPRTARSC